MFSYCLSSISQGGLIENLAVMVPLSHACLQGSPPVLALGMHEQTELWHKSGVAARL